MPDAKGDVLNVLAISGSLRTKSFNSGLVDALVQSAEHTESMKITKLEDWASLPMLNVDLLDAKGLPRTVQEVNQRIREADAVIIVTPEYCYGPPGGLKNLLDWQSLPDPADNTLRHKPVALLGASIGNFGTQRAQAALRTSLLFMDAVVMGKPEVYISNATAKFDDDGRLVHDGTAALLGRFLNDFEEHAAATLQRKLPLLVREFLFT